MSQEIVRHQNEFVLKKKKTFFLAAKNIINLLGDDDRLTIIGAAGEPISSNIYINARQTLPTHDPFQRTTRETKQYFFDFLHSLNKTNANTNHTLAFEHAFQLLRNATRLPSSGKTPILMLYISRGYATTPSETKNVLEAIAFGQSRLTQPVVISTCAVNLSTFFQRRHCLVIESIGTLNSKF